MKTALYEIRINVYLDNNYDQHVLCLFCISYLSNVADQDRYSGFIQRRLNWPHPARVTCLHHRWGAPEAEIFVFKFLPWAGFETQTSQSNGRELIAMTISVSIELLLYFRMFAILLYETCCYRGHQFCKDCLPLECKYRVTPYEQSKYRIGQCDTLQHTNCLT